MERHLSLGPNRQSIMLPLLAVIAHLCFCCMLSGLIFCLANWQKGRERKNKWIQLMFVDPTQKYAKVSTLPIRSNNREMLSV